MIPLIKPKQKMKLYFAYGSNLSKAQMQERCPASVPFEPYLLTQFRLEFVGESTLRWGPGGVATIIPSPVQVVPGALYRITPEDEEALDGFEGVDHAAPNLGSYYKEEGMLFYKGEPVLVYIATAKLLNQGSYTPNSSYLERINEGRSDWGLPALG